MKYIFSILLLFGFVAANAQATYPMRRTNGNAIVTDVALTATEYFRLPTFNASVPNLGSYADSSGRVLFNRFDSNILVRNNGSYLFFQPSTKTVNLAGAQTIFGNKTFTGSATFSGTNLFTTLATFNSTIAAGGEIQPATDIKWSNNTGFGLKGSDNNRFLSYTTAGGVVVGLSSAKVDIYHGATLALRTTSGGGINVTGTISRTSGTSSQYLMADGSVRTNVNSSIDTGRAVSQIVTGGSLNKVRDSLSALFSAASYIPNFTNTTNISSSALLYAKYSRISKIVTVYVSLTVSTSASGLTVIAVDLPFTGVSGTWTLTGSASSSSAVLPVTFSSGTTSAVSAKFYATAAESYSLDLTFQYEAS